MALSTAMGGRGCGYLACVGRGTSRATQPASCGAQSLPLVQQCRVRPHAMQPPAGTAPNMRLLTVRSPVPARMQLQVRLPHRPHLRALCRPPHSTGVSCGKAYRELHQLARHCTRGAAASWHPRAQRGARGRWVARAAVTLLQGCTPGLQWPRAVWRGFDLGRAPRLLLMPRGPVVCAGASLASMACTFVGHLLVS
jgi:hypothetical protein